MARGCCGNNKPPVAGTPAAARGAKPITAVPDDFPKVLVQYLGPPGAHSVIGYATHRRYGRHARGDKFYVHREDVEMRPDLFTVLSEPHAAANLPKVAEQVRAAPVPPPTPAPAPPVSTPPRDVAPWEGRLWAPAPAAPLTAPPEMQADTASSRPCAQCGKPLPVDAHPRRKYCDACQEVRRTKR